jgi:RNA polymerase sigma factor for flagellar operon FliA
MTYASFRIRGAVLSELRSRDYHSRSTRKKLREYENAYLRLENKSGDSVNDEEVAEEMGLSLDELYQIKRMSSISFLSFDEIGYSSKEEKDGIMSYFISGDSLDAFSQTRLKEIENTIAEAIGELPEKEKLVVSLYYWDELTMKEIGKVLEITESRVSQIHSQAIIHLRGKLRKEKLLED